MGDPLDASEIYAQRCGEENEFYKLKIMPTVHDKKYIRGKLRSSFILARIKLSTKIKATFYGFN